MPRNRYGEWHGGPDPLAPPYDVRGALDELGDSVLEGLTPGEALRDLMRRGFTGRRGHVAAVRRLHGPVRRLLSRQPAITRRARRLARSTRGCRAAADELVVSRTAGRARRADDAGNAGHRPGERDGSTVRPAASSAAGARLERTRAHARRHAAGLGRRD